VIVAKCNIRFISETKQLKSPGEFCAGTSSSGESSMDPDQRQNAGEGSNRQVYIPLDNENQFIDLNQPYEGENMNVDCDNDLDQVHNAEEESYIYNIE